MSEVTITVKPIVNINGTNKTMLLEQYRVALRSIKQSRDLAGQAYPHGRDYQLNSEPLAAETARSEYQAKVFAPLQHAADYLEALIMSVIDQ